MTRLTYKSELYTTDTAQDSPTLPVRVVYDFTPGTPETGAGYLAPPEGYDPGSPAEIDVAEIWLEPKGREPSIVPIGCALWNWLVSDLSASLEAHAEERAAEDHEEHLERRAEMRRERA